MRSSSFDKQSFSLNKLRTAGLIQCYLPYRATALSSLIFACLLPLGPLLALSILPAAIRRRADCSTAVRLTPSSWAIQGLVSPWALRLTALAGIDILWTMFCSYCQNIVGD